MASNKSIAAQNATWRKAAISSGSSHKYEVVNTTRMGVGQYVPVAKEPLKAK